VGKYFSNFYATQRLINLCRRSYTAHTFINNNHKLKNVWLGHLTGEVEQSSVKTCLRCAKSALFWGKPSINSDKANTRNGRYFFYYRMKWNFFLNCSAKSQTFQEQKWINSVIPYRRPALQNRTKRTLAATRGCCGSVSNTITKAHQ